MTPESRLGYTKHQIGFCTFENWTTMPAGAAEEYWLWSWGVRPGEALTRSDLQESPVGPWRDLEKYAWIKL